MVSYLLFESLYIFFHIKDIFYPPMSNQKSGLSLPVALAGMFACSITTALAMHFYVDSSTDKRVAKKELKENMIPSTALFARLLASPFHTPGLFKSLETAVTVLRIVVEDSDKITLVEKMQLNQLLSKLQCCDFSAARARSSSNTVDSLQIVVLEGLPGCGKSTLATSLGSRLNATKVYDEDFAYPPELQKFYDIVHSNMTETLVLAMMNGLPEVERSRFETRHRHAVATLRAVELVKLYFIMYDIISLQEAGKETTGTFVVVNYYHSLCATTLNSELLSRKAVPTATATEGKADETTTSNADEFCEYFSPQAFVWPFDLPKPSLVVYMAIQSEDRLARLRLRAGTQLASSEAEAEAEVSSKQQQADSRIQMAYSLVNNLPVAARSARAPITPTTVAMNASADAATVLQITLEICEDYGIFPSNNPISGAESSSIPGKVGSVPVAGTTEIDEIGSHLDLDCTPNVSRRRGTKSKSGGGGKRISLGMYSVF